MNESVKLTAAPAGTGGNPQQSGVGDRLDAIRSKIAAAAREAGRDESATDLVAVSKRQPLERVEAALEAGHRVFGENIVQDAMAVWPPLKDRYPDIRLHLVGPLQSNKVKDAVGLFDVIESIDRPRLVRRLAQAIEESGRDVRCLVQVNTGEEAQKSGVAPGDLAGLLDLCRTEGLVIHGLMCIPPVNEPPALHFALLAKLAAEHGLSELSMGMSDDYETAVRYGATSVRVGSAIFGARLAKGV